MDTPNEVAEQQPEQEPAAAPRKSPLAFRIILYSVLVVVIVGAVLYWTRVLYYERGLREYAVELIIRGNQNDLFPLKEGETSANPEVQVTCSFDPFLVGEPVGKIRLTVRPASDSNIKSDYTIAYICSYKDGVWKDIESYHEH